MRYMVFITANGKPISQMEAKESEEGPYKTRKEITDGLTNPEFVCIVSAIQALLPEQLVSYGVGFIEGGDVFPVFGNFKGWLPERTVLQYKIRERELYDIEGIEYKGESIYSVDLKENVSILAD